MYLNILGKNWEESIFQPKYLNKIMHQLAPIPGETTINVRRSHSVMTGKV
jgi:hypothetical protein